MGRLVFAGGFDAAAALGGEFDGTAAIGAVDSVEGSGDTVLTLSGGGILEKGTDHVAFLHDVGCHDAGFLVAVAGTVEFVCSGDGAGNDRPLIVAWIFEMDKNY